jgi:hypothetical protein
MAMIRKNLIEVLNLFREKNQKELKEESSDDQSQGTATPLVGQKSSHFWEDKGYEIKDNNFFTLELATGLWSSCLPRDTVYKGIDEIK